MLDSYCLLCFQKHLLMRGLDVEAVFYSFSQFLLSLFTKFFQIFYFSIFFSFLSRDFVPPFSNFDCGSNAVIKEGVFEAQTKTYFPFQAAEPKVFPLLYERLLGFISFPSACLLRKDAPIAVQNTQLLLSPSKNTSFI